MDTRWKLESFNLNEASAIGELFSNMYNQGDYSRYFSFLCTLGTLL